MIISLNQKQKEGESRWLALRITMASKRRRFFIKENFSRVHLLPLDFILHLIGQLCHMPMPKPIVGKGSGITIAVLD